MTLCFVLSICNLLFLMSKLGDDFVESLNVIIKILILNALSGHLLFIECHANCPHSMSYALINMHFFFQNLYRFCLVHIWKCEYGNVVQVCYPTFHYNFFFQLLTFKIIIIVKSFDVLYCTFFMGTLEFVGFQICGHQVHRNCSHQQNLINLLTPINTKLNCCDCREHDVDYMQQFNIVFLIKFNNFSFVVLENGSVKVIFEPSWWLNHID